MRRIPAPAAGTAAAIPRDDPDVCFFACQTALREPTYADVAPDARFLYKECHSRLMQTSLFLCVRSNCHGAASIDSVDYRTLAGLLRLNDTCTEYMDAPLPSLDSVLDAYPDDAVARLRRLQRHEATSATNISEPVVVTQQLYENSYDTLSTWDYVHGHHSGYSYVIFSFWCVVIFYGVCSRVLSVISHKLRRRRRCRLAGPDRGRYEQLDDTTTTHEEQLLEPASSSGEHSIGPADGDHIVRRLGMWPGVWVQRYIALPATFGNKCAQDFGWYTVPPRVQTLTIAAFSAINLYACCTGYRVFAGNMWWPEVSRQYYRYVSDRTGILSFVNFPLIWLFGMRNNLLLWLTGWDFGTYSNFHRWIARVATVEAIAHSVGYTILLCWDGGWHELVLWWSEFWLWTGGVATILMSLLLGLSVFWMRRRVYELFLVIHIIFSVLILLGMAGHVSIFRGRYDIFWLSASVIWILDRVLRAARILAFNPLFWRTRANITYDLQANITRLTVPYTSSLYQPQPGTYYYLHVLSDRRFWESHPFTVATVASLNRGHVSAGTFRRKTSSRTSETSALDLAEQASQLSISSLSILEAHGEHTDSPYPSSEAQGFESTGLLRGTAYGINQPYQRLYRKDGDNDDNDDNDDGYKEDVEPQQPPRSARVSSRPPSAPAHAASALTFLIRPYDSFTGRLRDYASGIKGSTDAGPDRSATVRVLVDGPYGHARRFDDGEYDSVLFIAGGSGIVVPMSHLTGIAHDRMAATSASSASLERGPPQCRLRSVHVVWAVREAEFAAAVLREDLQGVFGSHKDTGVHVSLDIYVTKRGDRNGETAHVLVDLPPSVRVLYGRPDVSGEIECAAKRDGARGRLGVVACGPGRMADEARRAVVSLIGRRGTTSEIEYIEESFQW